MMTLDIDTIRERLVSLGGLVRSVAGDLGEELKGSAPKVRETSARATRALRGFTLTEMLTVVGIILIMSSIGFVGVIQFRDNLRFLRMNDTAREIYIAAQDQMTRGVQRGGLQDKLDGASASYLGTQVPTGSSTTTFPDNHGQYYYVTHTGGAVSDAEAKTVLGDLLPANSIDEGVRQGQYVIVYNRETATVHEVFFTDGKNGTLPGYEDTLNSDDMRQDATRRAKHDVVIGYYGGSTVNLAGVSLTDLSVSVNNGNRLTAIINYPTLDDLGGKTAVLTLCVQGRTTVATNPNAEPVRIPVAEVSASGSSYTIKKSSSLADGFLGEILDSQPITITGSSYSILRAGIVLDDVTANSVSSGSHFAELFPSLIPGENIEIWAEMSVKGAPAAGHESNHVITNSLFAQKEEADAGALEVGIANFRHLENLDKLVSGFEAKKVMSSVSSLTATQIASFAWEDLTETEPQTFSLSTVGNTPSLEDKFTNDITNGIITAAHGASIIGSRAYFGVEVGTDPSTFTYNGAGNNIINAWMSAPASDSQNVTFRSVGLFRNIAVATATLKNIHLETPTVVSPGGTGVYAGTLVGEVRSSTKFTVENCQVWVDSDDDKKPSTVNGLRFGTITGDTAAAGGLIGWAGVGSGSITDSFVALRKITTSNVAGGFIGEVNGASGTLTIDGCYASGRTYGGEYDATETHELGYNVETSAASGATGGFVGKLTGRQSSGNGLEIRYSYSTASVKGANAAAAHAGGFVGYIDNGVLLTDATYATGLVFAATGDNAVALNANRHAYIGGVTAGSSVETKRDRNFYLSSINGSLSLNEVYATPTNIDKSKSDPERIYDTTGLTGKKPFLSCAELMTSVKETPRATALTNHVGDWPDTKEQSNDQLVVINTNRLSVILFSETKQPAVMRIFDPTDKSKYVDHIVYGPGNNGYFDEWVPIGGNGKYQYYCEWVLDDPTSEAIKQWPYGYAEQGQRTQSFTSQFGSVLTPGGNYQVAAVFETNNFDEKSDEAITSDVFNSLFADANTVESVKDCPAIPLASGGKPDGSVAYIAYARHLQNLNPLVSGVDDSYKTAVQIRDFYWSQTVGSKTVGETSTSVTVRPDTVYADNATVNQVWNDSQTFTTQNIYHRDAFTPNLQGVPDPYSDGYFYPIEGGAITSYSPLSGTGIIYNFKSKGCGASIFGLVNHVLQISNTTMVDPRIEGSWNTNIERGVGAFAGTVNGELRITSCSVTGADIYGTFDTGGLVGKVSGETHITNSSVSGTEVCIVPEQNGGERIGGLVGAAGADLTISGSTVTVDKVEGRNWTGGFVGEVNGDFISEKTDSVASSSFSGTTIESKYQGAGGIAGYVHGSVNVSSTSVKVSSISNGNNGGTASVGGYVGRIGNGGTIKGAAIESASLSGLCTGGIVGRSGGARLTIQQAEVKTSTVNGRGPSGGVVGFSNGDLTFTNVSATDTPVQGGTMKDADTQVQYDGVGGLVGIVIGELAATDASVLSTAEDASLNTLIQSSNYAGGVVGITDSATFLRVSNYGISVYSTYGNAGGIAGVVTGASSWTDVYVTDSNGHQFVNGSKESGGLAGKVGESSAGLTVKNCFSTAFVKNAGQGYAGGLFGYAVMKGADRFENSYSAGHTQNGIYGTTVPSGDIFGVKSEGYNDPNDNNAWKTRYTLVLPSGEYGAYINVAELSDGSAGGIIGYLKIAGGTPQFSNVYSTASTYTLYGTTDSYSASFIGVINGGTLNCTNCYAMGYAKNNQSNAYASAFVGSGTITGSGNYFLHGVNNSTIEGASSVDGVVGPTDSDGSEIEASKNCFGMPFDTSLNSAYYPYRTVTTVGPKTSNPDTTGQPRHFGDWVDISKIGTVVGPIFGESDVANETEYTFQQDALQIVVKCTNGWGTTRVYTVTISNNGEQETSGWTVTLPFQSAITSVDGPWNSGKTYSGQILQISNGNGNFKISAGGSTSDTFHVTCDSFTALDPQGLEASFDYTSDNPS